MKDNGLFAVEEAKEKYPHLLHSVIEQWEISPSFLCGNDCVGCRDRVSLYRKHLESGGKPEKRRDLKWWINKVNKIERGGGTYALLVGGELTTAIPWLPELMNHIVGMKSLDVGLFTDGISSYNQKTGDVSKKFKELVEKGRILDMTVHVSVDYFVDYPEDKKLPDVSKRTKDSRKFKSTYGLWLAKKLVELGAKRVVLNAVIKADNINEVIPIYDFCEKLYEKGNSVVLHSFSPWQHNPHLCRGDDPSNYPRDKWLTFKHYNQLLKVSNFILKDTWKRIKNKQNRIAANSSGYIKAVHAWITQNVGCHKEPGMRAIIPDGTVRLCPVMKTMEQILTCWGCSYGGVTDRIILRDKEGNVIGNRWTPTWGGEENKDFFLNLLQSTKRDYPHWK